MLKIYTQDQLKSYREHLYDEQGGQCPLCLKHIPPEEAVLDHSHSEGVCRAVLHNLCNIFEGKFINSVRRFLKHKGLDGQQAAMALLEYYEVDYSDQPLHITVLTPEQKELKKITKKLKKMKRASTIKKYKERAKELRLIIKQQKEENQWSLE